MLTNAFNITNHLHNEVMQLFINIMLQSVMFRLTYQTRNNLAYGTNNAMLLSFIA